MNPGNERSPELESGTSIVEGEGEHFCLGRKQEKRKKDAFARA
jgi:hypothetical protein